MFRRYLSSFIFAHSEHSSLFVLHSKQEFDAALKPGGEVLLAGGAIGSPQILMTSGVGPAKDLKEHGIPVVADLQGVGKNLQDQPAVVVAFSTPKKGVSVTSKLRIFGRPNPIPVLNWFLRKAGLLTSIGCDHGAFVRTKADASQADLQIRFIAARPMSADGMSTYTQFRNSKSKMVRHQQFSRSPFKTVAVYFVMALFVFGMSLLYFVPPRKMDVPSPS